MCRSGILIHLNKSISEPHLDTGFEHVLLSNTDHPVHTEECQNTRRFLSTTPLFDHFLQAKKRITIENI